MGAFNVTDLTQLEGAIEAAVNKKTPLIIQTLEPSKFFGRKMMVAAYRALAESAPIPICLHLDHCTDGDPDGEQGALKKGGAGLADDGVLRVSQTVKYFGG